MYEILDFIKRRFSINCNWLDKNCYYFSLILKDRFPQGCIYYDVIDGHFLFRYKNEYYDWTGLMEPKGVLIKWDEFDKYDALQKQVIVRDCIM